MASALWQATETLFMTIRANPAMTRQTIQSLTDKTLAPWVEQQDDMLARIHDGSATDALETTGNQLAKMKGLQAALQQELARSPMPSHQSDPASLLHAMVKNSLLRQYSVMAQNVADALGASNGPTAEGDAPVILREGEVTIPPGNPFTREQAVNLLSTLKPGEPVEKLIPLKFIIGEAAHSLGAAEDGDNLKKPAPSYSWAGRLLSEIWKGFVDDVIADREWKPAMRGQCASTFKLFRSMCGDRTIGDYSKADIAEFKRQLHRLPADYDKAPWRKILLARGKADPDFAGVIAAAAEADADKALKERVPKLKAKTINRHLTVINKLWVRAEANGAVAANTGKIAQGMAIKTRRASDEGSLLRKKGDRDFWDIAEMTVFFQLPFFLGCASSRSRLTPGIVIPMDALWWGCIIARRAGLDRDLGQVDAEFAGIDLHRGLDHHRRMRARHLVILDDHRLIDGDLALQMLVALRRRFRQHEREEPRLRPGALGQLTPVQPAELGMDPVAVLLQQHRMRGRELPQQEVALGMIAELRIGARISREILGTRQCLAVGCKSLPIICFHSTRPVQSVTRKRRVGSGSRGFPGLGSGPRDYCYLSFNVLAAKRRVGSLLTLRMSALRQLNFAQQCCVRSLLLAFDVGEFAMR